MKDTRTFYGDDPRAGAPAVADIHSLRDMGFVDEAALAWVEQNYGKDAREALARDSEGLSPGEAQYEWAADKMRDFTARLNKMGYAGGGWEPHELQAVGWTAMSAMLGRRSENQRRRDRSQHPQSQLRTGFWRGRSLQPDLRGVARSDRRPEGRRQRRHPADDRGRGKGDHRRHRVRPASPAWAAGTSSPIQPSKAV